MKGLDFAAQALRLNCKFTV